MEQQLPQTASSWPSPKVQLMLTAQEQKEILRLARRLAQVGRARVEMKWRNGLSRKNMHLDPTVKKAEERLIEYLKEVG